MARRHQLAPSSGAEAPRLPGEAELAQAARGAEDELDALLDGSGGPTSEVQALAAFEVLLRGLEGAEDPSAEPLPPPPMPETLREWFSDAKLAVNRLSPAMLSLLRRFLALKVG